MKKRCSIVILILLIAALGLTLGGCTGETEKRDVEIGVIHPITGEAVYALPSLQIEVNVGEIPENSVVKYVVRDKETKKLLTDDDLMPYTSLETCFRVGFQVYGHNNDLLVVQDMKHWPTKKGEYLIHLRFDSVDKTIGKYERRYTTTSTVISFLVKE